MELRWKHEWTVPSVVGAASFLVGAGVGYAFAKRQSNKELNSVFETINNIAEEQVKFIEDAQNDMAELIKEAEEVPEVILDEELEVIVLEEDRVEVADYRRVEHGRGERTSIFPTQNDNWDYEEEIASRTPGKPYIIHKDEFYTNESGYGQSTLTYYKGDDVLLDEADVPLYDAKNIVCELEFGKGSEDPSIVYVRNDRLEAEYEILLEHGFYAIEVLGVEMEESLDNDKPTLMKFRD